MAVQLSEIDADRPAELRKPSRRYEARRNAIIASAVRELNAKGVRGMTLGDVAARLDLVPTGVIYYFRNKEELAAACFQRAIDRFNQLLAGGIAAGGDDRARLDGFVRGYFEFRRRIAIGQEEQVAVFNDVRGLGSQAVLDAYVDMFRHARGLLTGRPEAPLPRIDRNIRTHLLLAEAFWSVVWIKRSEPEDYGRLAERSLSILLDGLAAPGVAWPQLSIASLDRGGGPGSDDPAELFLRAATQLINQEGYHGASVERISARLNVSKGAFYHHNETKDELVVACFKRTCEIMWRAIRAAEADGGSGLKVLAQTAAALVRFQLSGNLPLLRVSALSSVPQEIQGDLVARFDRLSHRFASILCDGVADGSIRPVDVNVAAQMITAMINAAADLPDWAPGLTPDAAEAGYVRPFFQGLACAAAPERRGEADGAPNPSGFRAAVARTADLETPPTAAVGSPAGGI